ncbi:hypothetical protein PanWU01x14_106850 [Parasponia andersonii]|uniref:Uncharacterized protein n=1 Tax=Parasponia andersonii TaxID=3476 RepID=A0A2P5D0S8_PARAD|nr:hypothetical protein PanWU01x14_106850 [Parasponia andersonii]
MQPSNTDVLFPGTLLRLDEPGGSVNTDNEVPGDLGIQGTTVTRFLDTEDPFYPSDDLVRRWIGWFIKIHDTVPDVLGERALERGVTGGKRSVVSGPYIEAIVVLEEDRPLRSVNGGSVALRLDHEIGVLLLSRIGAQIGDWLWGVWCLIFRAMLLLLLLGADLDLGHGFQRFFFWGGGLRVFQ